MCKEYGYSAKTTHMLNAKYTWKYPCRWNSPTIIVAANVMEEKPYNLLKQY